MNALKSLTVALLSLLLLTGWGFTRKTTKQKQDELQNTWKEALARLYEQAPGTGKTVS